MPLFNNPKKATYGIVIFILLFVASLIYSNLVRGAELDFAYGRTVIRGQTDVLALTAVWPKSIGPADAYLGMVLVGTYTLAPSQPGWLCSVCVGKNQVFVRMGVTSHIKRVGFTLGVAAKQHDDVLNTGNITFNLGLDYRLFEHVRVSYIHFSNAGTESPNIGRDMVTVGWRF